MLVATCGVAVLAPASAAAAPAPRLALAAERVERALVCGRERRTSVVAIRGRATATLRIVRNRRSTVTIERCADRRWVDRTVRRLNRGRGLHRLRVGTATEGDYRISLRSGAARVQRVYLRVGRGEPLLRKEVGELTAAERRDYVDALLKLKATRSPHDAKLSWYDQFVDWHAFLTRCNPADPLSLRAMRGHAGPIFLPWHRSYLVLLEDALARVSGKRIAVPYWDWTDPASTRAVFSDDFMGGDGDPAQGYAVTSGPFRKGRWTLNVLNFGVVYEPSNTTYLTRRMGSDFAPTLPTAADAEAAMRAAEYDVAPFNDASDPARSFRNALEGYPGPRPMPLTGCLPDGSAAAAPVGEARLHNRIHQWVGGQLPPTSSGVLRYGTLTVNVASPNDPVFFLLHANIDRIWAEWQAVHGTGYRPLSGYPNISARDVMHPLEEAGGVPTPESVEDITALGYRYGGSPAPTVTAPRRRTPLRSSRWLVCRAPSRPNRR